MQNVPLDLPGINRYRSSIRFGGTLHVFEATYISCGLSDGLNAKVNVQHKSVLVDFSGYLF